MERCCREEGGWWPAAGGVPLLRGRRAAAGGAALPRGKGRRGRVDPRVDWGQSDRYPNALLCSGLHRFGPWAKIRSRSTPKEGRTGPLCRLRCCCIHCFVLGFARGHLTDDHREGESNDDGKDRINTRRSASSSRPYTGATDPFRARACLMPGGLASAFDFRTAPLCVIFYRCTNL